MSVFCETYRAHIERRVVRVNFLLNFFDIPIFFKVAGAYTPMFQSEFPSKFVVFR